MLSIKWLVGLAGVAACVYFFAVHNKKVTPVVNPIQNFQAERYAGTWYEVLRLPHSFEKNLTQVTAEYRLNNDGTIEVTNRGFHSKKGRWQTAIGLAKPVAGLNAGFKVSFFWPFTGGYYIAELGSQYEYAVIVSDSRDYFWLLSRTPNPSQGLIDEVTAKAYDWGYNIDNLIRVQH
ncbi:hypothetical protein CWE15_09595 [Aliidiomarina taiwanensis]|uniref:Outer membrane lipoprotein Blc n=1 Tax=Aliidiomarina taiwanensis TaxID=946228 RepID=A0A432X037_9GAMM|nr:lipocalin family protein [Aliidiomarina taiwanensis]RUO39366.1 hypothetical protein CWE15_09595 [Aliidiomarina taiwanensis]